MTNPLRISREDGVAIVEMQSADGTNPLGESVVRALCAAFTEVARDTSLRSLILLGTQDVFCSGAPRELLLRLTSGQLAPADLALGAALLELPIPCVAAMEGHATGGGLALGLCADIIVMAEESRYGLTFMNMGFTPGMGTTRLLEHVLSPALAHELLYTGELRRGRDFAARSGINHILPKQQVRERAFDLARRIAEKDRAALLLLKATLSEPRRRAFRAALADEARMHGEIFARPETLARIVGEYIEEA